MISVLVLLDCKLKDKCTTTSNSVCEPLEGAYCVDVRDGGCARAQTHSSCKPGQHISERGWAADVDFAAQLVVKEESKVLNMHQFHSKSTKMEKSEFSRKQQ